MISNAIALSLIQWKDGNDIPLLQSILDFTPHGIFMLNPHYEVTYWNQAAEKIFGWKSEEILNRPLPIVPSELQSEFEKIYHSVNNGQVITNYDFTLQGKFGGKIAVSLSIAPSYLEGRLVGTIFIAKDVTEVKANEDNLYKTITQLRDIKYALDASTYFTITDTNGKIIDVNDKFLEITKYRRDEVIGQDHRIINSGYHSSEYYDELYKTIQSGRIWKGEMKNRSKDGTYFWADTIIVPFMHEDGSPKQYMAIRTDITARKKAEEELRNIQRQFEFMANHDYLTGIPNRRLLENLLDTHIQKANEQSNLLYFFFIDIDNFKYINDTMGHDQGDELLVEIAHRLLTHVSPRGFVARVGGDEFAIVLPSMESMAALRAEADQMIGLFESPFNIRGYDFHVTVSMGVSVYPNGTDNANDLMKHADVAMYRAKAGGRNQYKIYTPSTDVKTFKLFSLQNDLKKALADQQFLLHYQPKVDMEGKITGAEALLRWQHPKWGTVAPSEFIELAERSGNIIPIGNWVLETVCKQLKEWENEGLPPCTLAVNVSAVQFMQSDFMETVKRVIIQYEIDPKYLEIELTESAILSNEQEAIRRIQQLKEMGIQIALDDFGSGYSSLLYLKKLKVHTVKIDQSFIRDLETDFESSEIISAIIHLSRSLKLRTVAEGVETDTQFTMLKEKGCDQLQGYLFSKPVVVEQLKEMLRYGACDIRTIKLQNHADVTNGDHTSF